MPPAIGLADNGDFGKTIARFNLYPAVQSPGDAAFRYIHLHYDIRPENHMVARFHCSEALLIRAALLLNRAVSRPGDFDLRAIGVVHAALFLAAFALLALSLGGERPGLQAALLALAGTRTSRAGRRDTRGPPVSARGAACARRESHPPVRRFWRASRVAIARRRRGLWRGKSSAAGRRHAASWYRARVEAGRVHLAFKTVEGAGVLGRIVPAGDLVQRHRASQGEFA